jgi:hypothetical protein
VTDETEIEHDFLEPLFRHPDALGAAEHLNDIARQYQPSPILSVADAMALVFFEAIGAEDFGEHDLRRCTVAIFSRLLLGIAGPESDEEIVQFCGVIAHASIGMSRAEPMLLTSEGEYV